MDFNKEDFDRLLAWLHPDRDEAGKKYEDIRRRLIRYLTYYGCANGEDLADETINRVIKKVPEIADTYVGDPARYFGGVARNIRKELCNPPPPPPPPEPDPPDEKERRQRCLDKCMEKISLAEREWVVRYYCADKSEKIENRKKMSEELGIEPNALRIRLHRVRKRLRKCVTDCMKEDGDG